jgi:hypothetical protein
VSRDEGKKFPLDTRPLDPCLFQYSTSSKTGIKNGNLDRFIELQTRVSPDWSWYNHE